MERLLTGLDTARTKENIVMSAKGAWAARELGELEKDRYAELEWRQQIAEDREARELREENARRFGGSERWWP